MVSKQEQQEFLQLRIEAIGTCYTLIAIAPPGEDVTVEQTLHLGQFLAASEELASENAALHEEIRTYRARGDDQLVVLKEVIDLLEDALTTSAPNNTSYYLLRIADTLGVRDMLTVDMDADGRIVKKKE
jgi:hypothetical protein